MIRHRFSTVASLVVFSGVGAAASERGLVDAVPRDTVVWASIDVQRAVDHYPSLDVVRLFHDEEVQDFLAPAIDALQSDRSWRELMAVKFLLEAYGLPEIIGGHVSVAMVGAGIKKPGDEEMRWYPPSSPPESPWDPKPDLVLPEIVVEVETSGRVAFESTITRVFELVPEAESSEQTAGDLMYTRTVMPLEGVTLTLCHTFVGDRFVLAMREERLKGVVDAMTGEARTSLAADETFRRWRDASVRGSELLEVYVAGENLNHPAWTTLTERDRQEIHRTGLDGIRGLGLALSLEGGRLRDNLTVLLPKAEPHGVLRLFESFGMNDAIGGDVASDANAALCARIDVGTLFDEFVNWVGAMDPREAMRVTSMFAEVEQDTGVHPRDLFDSLGDQVSISMQLSRTSLIPEVTGSIAVRDPARLSGTLTALREVTERESDGDVTFGDITVEERPGFYLKIPGSPVSPAFMVDEERLTFALNPNALKRFVRGGPPERTLVDDNADFARCVATTVGQGWGDVAGFLYLDIASGAEFGLGTAAMFLPALNQELPFELDPALFPMPETVADYLSGALFTLRRGDRYVALDASGPFGGLVSWVAAAVVAAELQ